MKKKHLQPLTPAAIYARVSSDRQDVDLSVSAQLRALKEYAKANGYSVAREYVDEAESGRVADRPQFREMIEEGGKPKAPFDVILVWKFSRFTRKREHAVAFKSQLRRKGIRGVHHRAGRGQRHRQAARGNHRECGRILQRKFGAGGRTGNEVGRIERLLPRLTLPSATGRSRSATGRRSAPPWRLTPPPPR